MCINHNNEYTLTLKFAPFFAVALFPFRMSVLAYTFLFHRLSSGFIHCHKPIIEQNAKKKLVKCICVHDCSLLLLKIRSNNTTNTRAFVYNIYICSFFSLSRISSPIRFSIFCFVSFFFLSFQHDK